MSQSTPRFQRSSMRISSAGLERPTVTVKSARLQHDQRNIVSQQLCPSKLGDRSVNRPYQFVSDFVASTYSQSLPAASPSIVLLLDSQLRPPRQCTEPERLRGADRSCHSRCPNWEAHPTPDLLCPRGLVATRTKQERRIVSRICIFQGT